MADGKKLLSQYHNICPQLQLYHKAIQEELYRTRMLVNLLGRKHRFLGRWDDTLFRSAYSYKPQSTVGDLLNVALVRLYKKYGDTVDIILQVHDAIYTLIPEDSVADVQEILRECMIIPLVCKDESFMIDVDFSCGPRWGELKGI